MTQSRLTLEKFQAIIDTIDVIADPKKEPEKNKAFEAFRDQLFGLTPDELNNTRFTVVARWGKQNIAEYTVEKLLEIVFTRSPKFNDLCNVLDILFQCKIIEPAYRDELIRQQLQAYGTLPDPLTTLVLQYEDREQDEKDEKEKAFDDMYQREFERLKLDIVRPRAIQYQTDLPAGLLTLVNQYKGSEIKPHEHEQEIDAKNTIREATAFTEGLVDLVVQYKGHEFYDMGIRQFIEGEPLHPWEHADTDRKAQAFVTKARSQELTRNLRQQEIHPLLHQLFMMRLRDEPAAIDNINKVLALFFKYGADFNVRNGFKQTVMHLAADKSNNRLMVTLHNYGCGFNIIDSQNKTALDIADAEQKVHGMIGDQRIAAMEALGAKRAKDFANVQVGKAIGQRFVGVRNENVFSTSYLFSWIANGNIADFAYYCDRNNLREKIDNKGRTIVDEMIRHGKVVVFFENHAIRATIQSQFPRREIRRCLDEIEKFRLAQTEKDKQEAGLDNDTATNNQTANGEVKADTGVVEKLPVVSNNSMFSQEASKLKLICATKNFTKFKEFIGVKTPEELKGFVESVSKDDKTFTPTLFNNFIDLCVKLKKEKNDAFTFSEEELTQMKRVTATAASAKKAVRV